MHLLLWHFLFWILAPGALAPAGAQESKPALPKPVFQGDFFGEMPRAFCVIQQVDVKDRVLTVKLDSNGEIRRVPIKDDTELHFRDSWGELTDYFPGQHVMLFLYADEDRKWTYPRAVQDDIHMRARHNHFASVTRIDRAGHAYTTRREEKNGQGQVTKVVTDTVAYTPDAKVWKGETPQGIDSLAVGDEVIQQLVEKNGKLVAVEILDRKGDDAVRTVQDARHRQEQDRLGLPASINDLEPLTGSLVVSIAWSGADRAKADLKEGAVVTVVPSDGTKPFAAAICSMQAIDTRERLQLLVNARAASRLNVGQSLRLFLPGTGPSVPTGRSGIPASNR